MNRTVKIWQIGVEGKRKVRDMNLDEEAWFNGKYPLDLYRLVFQVEIPAAQFADVSAHPFYHFNRVDGSTFLEQYESQYGPVPMWSLSVGDIIKVGEAPAKRVLPMGWEELPPEVERSLPQE